MLKRTNDAAYPPAGSPIRPGQVTEAFETIEGDHGRGLLIVCDHASNAIPAEYGNLGLTPYQLARHIAYDIGVDAVTRRIAAALGVPAVMSRFSRLLIDPNRGIEDPTLVMRISDGAVVPGNARIDAAGIATRIERFYRPYDEAVGAAIARFRADGIVPALFSIHSFTPAWKGVPRPWHAGLLWDRDARFAALLIDALRRDAGLVVGDNEPYSGELEGDMMNRHATRSGLAHALIEIRQDLIGDAAGVAEWADRLARILPGIVEREDLHRLAPDCI
jgi:predicted N-formylglutamate amidohydrolase